MSSVQFEPGTVLQRGVRFGLPALLVLLTSGCSAATRPTTSSVDPWPPASPPNTICSAAGVQPTEPPLLPVRERLRKAVAADSVVSVSIAVLVDDRTVWSEAFGLADRDRRIDAAAGTPYAIASVTKPVTATAVLRLVERGTDEGMIAYIFRLGVVIAWSVYLLAVRRDRRRPKDAEPRLVE